MRDRFLLLATRSIRFRNPSASETTIFATEDTSRRRMEEANLVLQEESL